MNLTDGYVDLQVNGYAGVDFNADDTTVDDFSRACERLLTDGVAGILATVITDRLDLMQRRLENIRRACDRDPAVAKIVWGVHIEGPFLNEQPGYIGAHPPEHARPADVVQMQRLLDSAGGLARLVTLAPERDPGFAVTSMLARQKILVAAGHCDPTLEQLRSAIGCGLSMFTHLGNGCPVHMHRHDNIIQRVLACAGQLWVGLIADGVHLPYFVFGNLLHAIGCDRAFVVTDAISAAGLGPGVFQLANRTVVVDQDLATWSADKSHLVGSASTMPTVVEKLQSKARLSQDTIQRLTRLNPRMVMGRR
jgi:N-acetylglucosamine-6-phosphate deacetylase